MRRAGFLLLGPVEVRTGTEPVAIEGVRSRCVLAALLLEPNRIVSIDQIVDAAWGEHPPTSARVQAQNRISRLRRTLRTAQPDQELISTSGSGYLIRIDDDQLDMMRFARAVQRAGAAADPEMACQELVSALALWRGPALDGLDTPYFQAAAQQWEEQRLRALERRLELDLKLARHGEVVAELAGLVAEHPFRERFHALLMLALYRTGRQADALDVYRRARESLAEQLGLDPGAQLQRLHNAMLRGEVQLAEPAAPAVSVPTVSVPTVSVPRQLPADIAGFTGRVDELGRLDLLAQTSSLVTVIGQPGVGKTALALHWAHRVTDLYPDGQLFLNLRGYDPGMPLRPMEALVHMLGCLGVPRHELPSDVDVAAARYRTLLAGRKMLIVLDNARTADQVRPLLPGDPSCCVVVTSRDRLSGLVAYDGAYRVRLGLLADDDATTLLRQLIGGKRMDAEPQAAARIAELCSGLPLALRIASAHLADQPHRSLARYAADLAGGNRPAKLIVPGDEDRAVQAVLDRSYEALPSAAQRVFRLLGLIPGPDFTPHAVAALAGSDAARDLDVLVAAHLVQPQAADRYTLHDLIREYAGGKAATGDSSALRGWLEYLRDMALVANSFVNPAADPGKPDLTPRLTCESEAMAWFEAEQANLTAAVGSALQAGETELAIDIAQAFSKFFQFAGRTSDWVSVFERAYTAAEHLGETKAKYLLLNSLGCAYYRAGRYDDALEALQRCVEGREALGEFVPAASSRYNIALVYESVGRYEEALEVDLAALAVFEQYDAKPNIALVLSSGTSNVYQRKGLWEKALGDLFRALAIAREIGSQFRVAMTLNNIGATYLSMGQIEPARAHLAEGVELARRIGDKFAEALALSGMSEVEQHLGNFQEAIRIRLSVHEIYEQGLPSHVCESLNKLGELYVAAGMPDRALASYREALDVATRLGERHQHGVALAGVGELTGSRDLLEAALRLLDPIGAVHADRVRQLLSDGVG